MDTNERQIVDLVSHRISQCIAALPSSSYNMVHKESPTALYTSPGEEVSRRIHSGSTILTSDSFTVSMFVSVLL